VDHDAVVAKIMERGAKLGDLARDVLTSPQAAWWFGSLDRTQQLWLSRDGSTPAPDRLNVAKGPPTPWERYAQKPAQGLYTSTLVDGTSSMLAALVEGVGDLAAAFQVRPLACSRLEASPTARVFKVDGPQAWHELCVRYPARTEDGLRKRLLARVRLLHRYPAIGEDGRLVPDWSAVAQGWDAVHLTLGGLLTAEQVRIESPAGWTQHQGWECEQTVWLRWCFITAVRLPDVEQYSLSPLNLSSLTWTL